MEAGTARTLRDYQEYLLNEGLATSSIRTYEGRLRIVLKACEERGWDPDALMVELAGGAVFTGMVSAGEAQIRAGPLLGVEGMASAIKLPAKPLGAISERGGLPKTPVARVPFGVPLPSKTIRS